ncbi:nitroreductase family protein [Niallia circulans]|uniref:nitroreductase family protein n=1 Tax=Niallia circulans TaxID=1397 RepID=UPI0002F6488A|nr:nitroreductase family protein [Niallia circulans]
MIHLIKNVIPASIKPKFKMVYLLPNFAKNYLIDMNKYLLYSSTIDRKKSKDNYEACLMLYSHKIEKGMSFSKTRIGYGKGNVQNLISILEEYTKKYGWNDLAKGCVNTLYAYYFFHQKNGLKMEMLYDKLELFNSTANQVSSSSSGGIIELTKSEIDKSNVNFKDFAYTRYSIRNFGSEEVSLEKIQEAVEIAQKTPSVCNRQTSRIYVFTEKKSKEEVLKYQNGNAGFGKDASKILIITSKLENFIGINERNQSFIDGGLYAMSLIYALHSLGIATCCLNLAVPNNIEKKLKKVASIGESENLIMMIAVGSIPEKLNVAASYRRNATEVMTIY